MAKIISLESKNETSSIMNEKDKTTVIDGKTVDTSTGEIKDTEKSANTTSTVQSITIVKTAQEKENEMRQEVLSLDLKSLDVKLMYEMMAIPSKSGYEYRMVTYLILWARQHNIEHTFDTYGNLYFVKGKPKEGEFYPCVTAHLDTVQEKQKAYVYAGADLDLKTRKTTKGTHEVYVDGMGTGSDDKNAILIALHMFERFDTLKGAFFLGEETGMQGSSQLDPNFFEDVSYVIGFDSPELNRAAWSLLGTAMFTADFYKTYMKEICDKYGMTKFYTESFTDEKQIIQKTGIMCMNFGNGGYSAHMPTEYFVVEELDHALTMGIELVENIPVNIQHKFKTYTWEKDENGELKKVEHSATIDEAYLRTLGDNTHYSSYFGGTYGGNYSGSNWSTSSKSNSASTVSTDKSKDENSVNEETVQYIVDMYDNRIEEIEKAIKEKCEKLSIDYTSEFAEIFSKEIKF